MGEQLLEQPERERQAEEVLGLEREIYEFLRSFDDGFLNVDKKALIKLEALQLSYVNKFRQLYGKDPEFTPLIKTQNRLKFLQKFKLKK